MQTDVSMTIKGPLWERGHGILPKTRSSLMFFMQNQRPAGNVQTRMCRSKKNETQVVGWCSDTDAMIGMWILAYLQMQGDIKSVKHTSDIRHVLCIKTYE